MINTIKLPHKNLMDPEKFHRIINYLWMNDKYSKANIFIFNKINSLSAKKGYCYATNEYIQNITGISSKTLKRTLKLLEEEGFIRRELSSNGTRRRIYLSEEVLKNIPEELNIEDVQPDEPVETKDDYFIEDVIEEEFGPTIIEEESIPEINEKNLNDFLNELE